MTDHITTERSATSKKPTHGAYFVRDGKRDEAFWTRIGSAWPHSDGSGFNVQLDGLIPLDGRITLRILAQKAA